MMGLGLGLLFSALCGPGSGGNHGGRADRDGSRPGFQDVRGAPARGPGLIMTAATYSAWTSSSRLAGPSTAVDVGRPAGTLGG